MSTENILQFGPNTADIGGYARTIEELEVGSEYMEGTAIHKVSKTTVRVCYSRGPENCFACVHGGWAKGKNCEVPASSNTNT